MSIREHSRKSVTLITGISLLFGDFFVPLQLMKRASYIFLIVLMLAACGGWRDGQRLLDRADSLLYGQPDSALRLLDSITEDDQERMSEAQLMRYHLLRADAQNKCFVPFTTDSVMKEVAHYYERKGTPNEQMRAFYLLGRAYYDMGETPMALKYFHEAADCADTTQTDCDFKLLSRVHGQMGRLFLDQGAPRNALDELDDAQQCALACGDTLMYISSYSFKGSAYEYLNMADSALDLKRAACRLYERHGYEEEAAKCMVPVLDILVEKGNMQEAARLMSDYERSTGILTQRRDIPDGKKIYLGTKGYYYLKAGKLDSALLCFNRLLTTATIPNHYECSYNGLSLVYKALGSKDSALKYSYLANEWKDSCYREKTTTYYQQAKAQYDYSRNQQLVDHTMKAKDRVSLQFKMLLGVALILLLISYIIYRHYRESLLREENLSKLLSQLTQKKLELEGKLVRSEEEKRAEIENLEAELDVYRKKEKYRRRIQLDSVMNDSDIVKLFRRYGMEKVQHPTSEEWASLQKYMNEMLPNFFSVLISSEGKLNEFEIQLCMLRRLQIPLPDVAFIMNRDSNLLSVMRRRILEKVFRTTEGGAKELDRRLLTLW